MQEGMLIISKKEEAVFWVRRSYERALDESLFNIIKPMNSFQDAVKYYSHLPDTVFLETEFVSLAMYQRFRKHFPFLHAKPVDPALSSVRSIKSNYELNLMRQSGKIHETVLEELVPSLLVEGISEVELSLAMYQVLVREGHHGLVRFAMFDTEMILGHVAFGENSLYPTSFNGPGGHQGLSPAVPFLGSRDRRLAKGDLVFVDIGCGVEGYHTDKTMTYMFGKELPSQVKDIHNQCVSIQNSIAGMLIPGAVPSEIYNTIISGLPVEFLTDFMGYGKRQVKFLGHGIGLTIDELPVIAQGFDEPIREGMVFAVEPKKGVQGIGMVGIENTFEVTHAGGKCITGSNPGLIPVIC
jgi:Xaa-Pro aminopeptidase